MLHVYVQARIYREKCLRFHYLHLPVLISNVSLPVTVFAHFWTNVLYIFFNVSEMEINKLLSVLCAL